MPVIRCPNPECGARLMMRPDDIGRSVRCPKCGRAFEAVDPGSGEMGGGDAPSQGVIRLGGRETGASGEGAAGLSPYLLRALGGLKDYEILEQVGAGGMGIVFKARQRSLNRIVALKVIRPELLISEETRQRFHREAEAVAAMNHPGIVAIYEARQVEALDYFSMEFIEGRSLDGYVKEERLSRRRLVSLIRDIADAVDHAHELGVIHRDLKPSNIMVTPDGRPHILDFGLARLRAVEQTDRDSSDQTMSGVVVGTFAYMSPEQTLGRSGEIDGRSDVYSLGVILYEVLTGRLPYPVEGDVVQKMYAIRQRPPARPSSVVRGLKGELEVILLKALEKEKERRYRTARAFADDLGRWVEGRPVLARKSSRAYRAWKFVRRHKPVSVAAAVAMLFLIGGLALHVRNLVRMRLAAQRTEVERRAREEVQRRASDLQQRAEADRRAREEAQRGTTDAQRRAALEAYHARLTSIARLVKEASPLAHAELCNLPSTWEVGWLSTQVTKQTPFCSLRDEDVPLAWTPDGCRLLLWRPVSSEMCLVDVNAGLEGEAFSVASRGAPILGRTTGAPIVAIGRRSDLLLYDGQHLWYKEAGQPPRPLGEASRALRELLAIASTTDGGFVGVGYPGWRLEAGLAVVRISPSTGKVRLVRNVPVGRDNAVCVLSPDGTLVAVSTGRLPSGTDSAKTVIYSLETAKPVATIPRRLDGARWTSDSQVLFVLGSQRNLWRWSRKTGAYAETTVPVAGTILSGDLLPDGRLICLVVEDLARQQRLRFSIGPPPEDLIRAVVVNPSSLSRATSRTSTAGSRPWRYGRGYHLLANPDGHSYCLFKFKASTRSPGTPPKSECAVWRMPLLIAPTIVRRWDAVRSSWLSDEEMSLALRPSGGLPSYVRFGVYSAVDGRWLGDQPVSRSIVSGGAGPRVWTDGGRILVHRPGTDQPLSVPLGKGDVQSLYDARAAWHPSGRFLAVTYSPSVSPEVSGRFLAVIDVDRGETITEFRVPSPEWISSADLCWTRSGWVFCSPSRSSSDTTEVYCWGPLEGAKGEGDRTPLTEARSSTRPSGSPAPASSRGPNPVATAPTSRPTPAARPQLLRLPRPAGTRRYWAADTEFLAYHDERAGTVAVVGPSWGVRAEMVPDTWDHLKWSRAGHLLALGSKDGLAVWNPDDRQFLLKAPTSLSGKHGLCWDVRGRQLTCQSGQTTRLFDLERQEDVALSPQGHRWITGSDWSPDGRLLALPLADCTIDVWDLDEQKVLVRLEDPARKRGAPRERAYVAWNADHSCLAVCRGGDLRVWSIPDGVLLTRRAGQSAKWSPAGVRLRVEESGAALALDREGRYACGFGPFPSAAEYLCLDSDARILLSASQTGALRRDHLQEPLAASLGFHRYDEVLCLYRTEGEVGALVREGEAYRLVGVGGASSARPVRDVPKGRIAAAAPLNDGQRLAVVLQSGRIASIEMGTGACTSRKNHTSLSMSSAALPVVASSSRSIVLVALPDRGAVFLINATDWSLTTLRPAHGQEKVTALALAHSDRTAVLGFNTGRIEVWNTQVPALTRSWQAGAEPISALALNSDGSRLFSATGTSAVHLWSVSDRAHVFTLATEAPVRALHLSVDDCALAVGMDAGHTAVYCSPFPARQVPLSGS